MINHMKNSLKIIALLVSAVLAMASCEGPMGPTGADGSKGDKGDKGDPGTTLACAECHNSNAQVPIFSAQWSTSTHATGENAAYANRTGCVQCHTSQGFLEYVAEGSVAAISLPEHPSQITCYTCHKIHKTFSDDDWALTKPGHRHLMSNMPELMSYGIKAQATSAPSVISRATYLRLRLQAGLTSLSPAAASDPTTDPIPT